ncbi:MAG: hypothetical protein IJK20_03530 [Bacteroidales bacterium]|nr:hypothetical protein [Bacteroidales bacterium]
MTMLLRKQAGMSPDALFCVLLQLGREVIDLTVEEQLMGNADALFPIHFLGERFKEAVPK